MEFSNPYKILELISKRLGSQWDEEMLYPRPHTEPSASSDMAYTLNHKHSTGI